MFVIKCHYCHGFDFHLFPSVYGSVSLAWPLVQASIGHAVDLVVRGPGATRACGGMRCIFMWIVCFFGKREWTLLLFRRASGDNFMISLVMHTRLCMYLLRPICEIAHFMNWAPLMPKRNRNQILQVLRPWIYNMNIYTEHVVPHPYSGLVISPLYTIAYSIRIVIFLFPHNPAW